MFSLTFIDASNANLLLDPVIKFSNLLLGSIRLYWRWESFINEIFWVLLIWLRSFKFSLLSFFFSIILNSILTICFLCFLIVWRSLGYSKTAKYCPTWGGWEGVEEGKPSPLALVWRFGVCCLVSAYTLHAWSLWSRQIHCVCLRKQIKSETIQVETIL